MRLSVFSSKYFFSGLWVIVFLALAIRILCALPVLCGDGSELLRFDSHTYLNPAYSLLADGTYSTAPDSGEAATTRPPGYSVFIAAVLLVSGKSLVCLGWVGCLAGALTCFPVGLCGRSMGNSLAGWLAALLFALNLTALAHSPMILADTLLGFFSAWGLFFMVRSLKHGSVADFSFAVLFFCAACYFKPIVVPVIVLALPLLTVFFFGFSRKTLAGWTLLWISYFLFLAPWMLRNYRAGADYDMDSNRGDLYYHCGSAILGVVTGENTGVIRNRLRAETDRYFVENQEMFPLLRDRNAYNYRKYFGLIRRYPFAFLQTHLPQYQMLLPDLPTFLENNRKTITGRGTLDVMRAKGVFAALKHYLDGNFKLILPAVPFLLMTLLLYAGVIGCLLIWLFKWRWRKLALFAVFGLYLLFAGGPVVMPRYQIPALPILCTMAACFYILLTRKSNRREKV